MHSNTSFSEHSVEPSLSSIAWAPLPAPNPPSSTTSCPLLLLWTPLLAYFCLQYQRAVSASSSILTRLQVNGATFWNFFIMSSRSNSTRSAEHAWDTLKCKPDLLSDAWIISWLSISWQRLNAHSTMIGQEACKRELRMRWVPGGDLMAAAEALYSFLSLSKIWQKKLVHSVMETRQ